MKIVVFGPDKQVGAIDDAGFIVDLSAAYAKLLPSHPDNVAKQLPVNLAWYIKSEADASAAYQNMLTE